MFRSESELVEKLVSDLQNKYGIQYIVRELRSGNNIADVAYAADLIRENVIFDEYLNAYYYFSNVYNHKRVNLDKIEISNQKFTRKFSRFLSDLEEQGYIKISGNYVTTIKKIDTVTKKFIAVEAKLSDWKAGLEQAYRYKQFADEVYVAIDSDYVCKVDKQIMKSQGIGLMSVSDKALKISLPAQKSKQVQLDVQYYIMDRFLMQLAKQS